MLPLRRDLAAFKQLAAELPAPQPVRSFSLHSNLPDAGRERYSMNLMVEVQTDL
jgi:hypothetical protein